MGFSIEHESERPVGDDRDNHEDYVDGLAPCIEEQRCDEQPDVLELASRTQEVQRHEHGQEREEEFRRGEDHGGCTLTRFLSQGADD